MCRIDRNEALERIRKLEDAAAAAGDRAAALCYVRAYNAVMSCRVRQQKKSRETGTEASRDR